MYLSTKKACALLAAGACLVAVLSLFLPMWSVELFGSWSISGFELIEELEEDAYGLIVGLGCSALGMISALLGTKNHKLLMANLLLSLGGVALMFIGYGEIDDLEYAAVGFYVFIVAHLAVIVLSLFALIRSDGTSNYSNYEREDYRGSEIYFDDSNQVTCPACGAEQSETIYCQYCGALMSGKPKRKPEPEAKPKKPKPEPEVKPKNPEPEPEVKPKNPEPEPEAKPKKPEPEPEVKPKKADGKNRKAVCPHCGARQAEGTVKCKYCGTAMDGSDPVAPPPEVRTVAKTPVVSHVGPAVSPKDRKAVCPHCGARQSTENANCKYCGTAMR